MSDVKFYAGGHRANDLGEMCVMEYVALLAGEQWTDLPTCTDRIVAGVAQMVNDRLDDMQRQRLVPLVPRLLRAHPVRDEDKARRVHVRVACWAARSVLHLIDDEERRAVAQRAIETAEAWLRGDATNANAAAAAANANANAAAANAANAEVDLVLFLDDLLDQFEKAKAEEGVLIEDER